MPFMIHVDSSRNLIYQKIRGVYNQSHVSEANNYIKTIQHHQRFSILLDMMQMKRLDIPEPVLERMGEKIRQEIPVRLRAIVASPRHIDELLAFADHASNAFTNVRVFPDLGQACDWLLIAESDIRESCLGYRPDNTVYDSESDHWSYQDSQQSVLRV